jgi:hypothetical protein
MRRHSILEMVSGLLITRKEKTRMKKLKWKKITVFSWGEGDMPNANYEKLGNIRLVLQF